MAITNLDRIGKAMELLKQGLYPFVERELRSAFKDQALAEAQRFVISARLDPTRPLAEWDAAVLLHLMWGAWNDVFRRTLGQAEAHARERTTRRPQQVGSSGEVLDRRRLSCSRFGDATTGCSVRKGGQPDREDEDGAPAPALR